MFFINIRFALLRLLSTDKFKLYAYGETLNAQEKYFAYMALSAPSDRLFVSFRNGSADGFESIIVSELKNIFPNLEVHSAEAEYSVSAAETDANTFEILASNFDDNTEFIATLKEYFADKPEFESRLSAVERLSKNEDIIIKNPDLARKLFKNDMYLSVSKIEDYYKCAFKYYCKFGLNARPRIKAEMNPMETGSVIHYVLECIVRDYGSKGLIELDSRQITAEVKKYLKQYLESKMGDYSEFTVRFKYRFMYLSKLISCVVLRLREEFENCDFEPKAFELSIGNGENGESVKSQAINLPDGGTIQIRGSIDRVDTYTENGEQYVRVVDYKSGIKKFKLSDILYGLNLQMFVYLFTLCKSDNELAGKEAGVLYLHSSRKIYNVSRNAIDSGVLKEDSDAYKMVGVVLNDEENQIAEHMEHDLKGEFIDVKCSAKSGVSGSIVSLEDMGRISRKIDSLIEQMGVELHMGKIMQNPVNSTNHNNTCEFCDYSSVCANRKEIELKEIEELSFSDTIEKLKEDDVND